MSSSTLGKNLQGDWPQLMEKKLNFSQEQGTERAVFIIDKQLHQLREWAGCVTVPELIKGMQISVFLS